MEFNRAGEDIIIGSKMGWRIQVTEPTMLKDFYLHKNIGQDATTSTLVSPGKLWEWGQDRAGG